MENTVTGPTPLSAHLDQHLLAVLVHRRLQPAADAVPARQHRPRLAGEELHADFFPRIEAEHARTRDWVLRLNGNEWLLQHDQRLALSIRLRNPYVDPISVLQADLLARWRASGREDEALLRALVASVNGVSQGVQNTG